MTPDERARFRAAFMPGDTPRRLRIRQQYERAARRRGTRVGRAERLYLEMAGQPPPQPRELVKRASAPTRDEWGPMLDDVAQGPWPR